MKKIVLTKTVKRTAVWYGVVLISFYLLFSLFTLFELDYILVEDLDSRLTHELEHILNTISVENDSIKILHRRELEEPDLKFKTDNPYFLQVYNLKGVLFLKSENVNLLGNIDLGFPNKFTPYYFEDLKFGNEQLRTIYKQLINQNGKSIGVIQLSAFQSSFNSVVKSVIIVNLISFPVIVIIVTLLSIFLAQKSYKPINKIIETANSISATNLSGRLDYSADSEDELGKLKNTLNSLFERLENQIKEISQFTDNASHQLMTPLTSIKTELDYILKRDHEINEYKETCKILKDQTDRMIEMIRTMLIMSRDCNSCEDNQSVFNISSLLKNDIAKIFDLPRVNFNIQENIYVRGKSEYFSIAVQNLINNAIKYSPQNSIVEVVLHKENNKIILKIIDDGIGIKGEEKNKVFQRFYRIESVNSTKISGYGLGLSLVKSVIERMSGEIEILDNKPKGSIFKISLPMLNMD
ncbi:MAG: HAMP domain-containing histidine kinase [Ignavibacteriae bacterium]|nr:HAMP domain-containing histidine kinase [Ignavibacteriota bacterium]